MKKILVLLNIILLTSCFSQNNKFVYKELPKYIKFENKYILPTVNEKIFLLESALPNGFSKKGDIDYTAIVQQVLKEQRNILFPNFPLLINDKGLYVRSNTNIYFQKYSKIIAKPSPKPKTDMNNIKEWYDILRIYDQKNINLYNLNIVGDRKKHNGKLGEWGAGIGIRNSCNVNVYNSKVSNTWGEGIFIGSEDGGHSENIYLQNIFVDYARRNGIAITSGVNIKINGGVISNTYGTAPMCGIDIEPSWYNDLLDQISLKNIYTFNNNNVGICLVLNAFSTKEIITPKNLNIEITNHVDYGSAYSFAYMINDNDYNTGPTGVIKIKNSKWINPLIDFYHTSKNKKLIKLETDSIEYIKNNEHITLNLK